MDSLDDRGEVDDVLPLPDGADDGVVRLRHVVLHGLPVQHHLPPQPAPQDLLQSVDGGAADGEHEVRAQLAAVD